MMNKVLSVFILCLFFFEGFSQSNSLTNSPYSMYGLGEKNLLNSGKTNALGNTGIALPSQTSINNLNPASYGAIPLNHFFFDVGVNYQFNKMGDIGKEESKTSGNFSNLSFALPINKKSGIGLSLTPYSNVGYNISTLENNIEGSTSNYYTSIDGYGGINELSLSYGYALSESLRLGISGELLFGKITEHETNYIDTHTLELISKNYYSGFKAALGFQYAPSKRLTFGGVIKAPANLGTTQDQTLYQYYNSTLVESSTTENSISDFSLPLEMGLGISSKLGKGFIVSADYTREFWGATDQSDNLGNFVDRDFIGLGLQFLPQGSRFKYANRIEYRLGMNYDSGNLEISETRTRNYSVNVGLGLPVSTRTNSMFNLMYSYGKKGMIDDGLIQENYHTISLNLSFQDLWFVKRKFN